MLYKTSAFVLMILLTSLYIIYTHHYYQNVVYINSKNGTFSSKILKDGNYLVFSEKCKIPNFDPFNQDVIRLHKLKNYWNCRSHPLLTYITYLANDTVLCINETAFLSYKAVGLKCCYSNVTRLSNFSNSFDNKIGRSECVQFKNNVTVTQDVVVVNCQSALNNTTIYKNVHVIIRTENKIQHKLTVENNKTGVSVLLIGIDSVSRLNFIRSMPKTHDFVNKQKWLELKGYNKIGDNTFPNLMAILTGMNESASYAKCVNNKDSFDKCNMLWYDYRKLGYVTAYAEDEASINTFNYNKRGFKNPPTDYYFRPYMLAVEKFLKTKNIDGMTYCTGPETSGERVFNLITDFAKTFVKYLYFGVFWMNSFSHNELNSVSRMDKKVYQLLENLTTNQLLNNTIVFFFSDHGLRFGNFRYTTSGWLEERLPFFYVYVPESFKKTHASYYSNLKLNANKLTTPYDFYMTLQNILNVTTQNYSVKPANACPRCQSLFSHMDGDRSCSDASIEQHWCTCSNYRPYSVNSFVESGAKHVITHIHQTIKSYGSERSDKCLVYRLHKVLSSSISSISYNGTSYLLILFQTFPSSVFEATISFNEEMPNNFALEGDISRLDFYQPHSKCVQDGRLKKYCYCKKFV